MSTLVENMRTELNAEQFAAATHTTGNLVVTACAGSGKTHTLAARVRYLREVDPDARILMISFTKNAANEMEIRVSRDSQTADNKILASTYHGFCYLLLEQYGRFLNICQFNVIKPSAYEDYIKAAAGQYPDLYKPLSGRMQKRLAGLYSKAANSMTTIPDLIQTDDAYEDLLGLEMLAESLKDETDLLMRSDANGTAVTYDDLLVDVNELLNNDSLAKHVGETYKYIMVDEYQDTNNLQEAILLKLAKYNSNIMVVGDASQSIYGFRAANVRIIQEFHNRFAGATVMSLPQTYRCTQEICDFANRVMHGNHCSWNYCDMVSAYAKHGKKPRLYRLRDAQSEAAFVLDHIFELVQDGCQWSDIGILSRSSMQTAELEVLLGTRGIAFNKYGGKKFIEHRCVVSVMAYLTLLTNPYDLPSIQNVLCVEQGIGNVTASRIAIAVNKSKVYDIGECYKQPRLKANQKASLQKFCTFLNGLRLEEDFHKQFTMVAEYYVKTWRETIESSNMSDKEEALEELHQGVLYIQQLESMSLKYDSPVDFVNDMNVNAAEESDDDDNKLTISTVHSAKGLEWKVVFVMSCYEGGFPQKIDPMCYGSEKDEEELRCFYVAITRAAEELVMTMPERVLKRSKEFGAFMVQADPSHYILHARHAYDTYREVGAYQYEKVV